jgi:hypothetical protein
VYFLPVLANVVVWQINSFQALPSVSNERLTALRSTLTLCIQGLHEQGQHVHVARLACRLLQERMDAKDRELLKTFVNLNEDEEDRAWVRAIYPPTIPYPLPNWASPHGRWIAWMGSMIKCPSTPVRARTVGCLCTRHSVDCVFCKSLLPHGSS